MTSADQDSEAAISPAGALHVVFAASFLDPNHALLAHERAATFMPGGVAAKARQSSNKGAKTTASGGGLSRSGRAMHAGHSDEGESGSAGEGGSSISTLLESDEEEDEEESGGGDGDMAGTSMRTYADVC